MTRDRARPLEVLDAIERVMRFVQAGRAAFLEDDLLHSAVLYRIGSIGESVKGLSTAFRERHPEVNWKQIAGIRDVVTHKYYGVRLESVWLTVQDDLPTLRSAVERTLASDPDVAG